MEISEVPPYIRVTNSWREGKGPLIEDYWEYLPEESLVKVKEYREWLGLNKREIAERIGIHSKLYSRFERDGIIRKFSIWRGLKIIFGDIIDVPPPIPDKSISFSVENRAYNVFQHLLDEGVSERNSAATTEYITRLAISGSKSWAGVSKEYIRILKKWKAGVFDV